MSDQAVQSKQPAVGAGPGFYILITAVFTAALALTIYYCRTMSRGMKMPGGWKMSMTWMRMPGQTWLGSTIMFMLTWLAMMVAMMLPSFLPVILRHHCTRRAETGRGAVGSTSLVMAGYFFVWSAAGALIYAAGIALADAAMRWTAVSRSMPFIFAVTVFIAGCVQFICPGRNPACVNAAGRSPVAFSHRQVAHGRRGKWASVRESPAFAAAPARCWFCSRWE
jgi:predicted metal-binding membrane protein